MAKSALLVEDDTAIATVITAALEDEGFENVQTVVASGNVLFEHDKAPDAALEQRIAQVIKDRFGINSFAAVRSRD